MTQSATADTHDRSRWHRARPDVLGVAWLVLIAVAFLTPAFWHGSHIGTYDILSHLGLSKQASGQPHNLVNADQIDSMIPWTHLVWTQVHQGHLPLWNQYTGLGLPLAFNWQSAPLGLPALVGYAVPVQYAYDVGQLVTLIVAGTGVYLLSRVSGLGVVASAFAGSVFELSGPLTGWIGYPHGEVMSWGGWLLAAAVLVIRPAHRAISIAFFAVVIAASVYSGQPEVLAVFGLGLGLFVLVVLGMRSPWARGGGPILRPVLDLALASIAGLALAAPLALPGFQVIAKSSRSGLGAVKPLQVHDLMYFIAQGFDGLPLAGSRVFGPSFFYEETAAYVGIIAVVLALVAISTRIRRPEVLALTVVTAIMLAIVFVPPINSFMDSLPVLGKVSWDRALMAVALGVAALAGFGLDALVRFREVPTALRWAGAWFAVAGGGLALIFVLGRGTLPPPQAHIRATSFTGPAFGILLGLVVVAGLVWVQRRHGEPWRHRAARAGTVAGVILLVGETVFLLSSGVPILSSSSTYLRPTPAERALRQTVGTALVGFGPGQCGQLGVDPSVNDAYGIFELDAYDPVIPQSYYSSWVTNTHTGVALQAFNEFCPEIGTVAEARLYGVSYVLEQAGTPGPAGSTLVRTIGDEVLFHVPRSGIATLTPLGADGSLPSIEAPGTPVPVTRPDPASLDVRTSADRTGVLRLRLTNLPGWKATIDGRPLALVPFAGSMLQARIPAGNHLIALRYWPSALTVGIIVAASSAAVLILAVVVERRRSRRPAVDPSSPSAGPGNGHREDAQGRVLEDVPR